MAKRSPGIRTPIVGETLRFDGRSPDGKTSGFFEVEVITPNAGIHGSPKLIFSIVKNKRSGLQFEAYNYQLSEIMKKNPAARKNPRTPAQRAATARMLAANRAKRTGAGTNRTATKRTRTAKRLVSAAKIMHGKQHAYRVYIVKKNGLRLYVGSFAEKTKAVEYGKALSRSSHFQVAIDY